MRLLKITISCHTSPFEDSECFLCVREKWERQHTESGQCCFSASIYTHSISSTEPIAEPDTCSLVQQAKVRLELKTRLRSCGKLDALPTTNDTALKNFISCEAVFFLRKQVCWAVAPSGFGNCFPRFWRNVPPESSRLWLREFIQNTENEGSTFLRNTEKWPSHTPQPPRRHDSTTISRWPPQTTFFIVKNALISDYFMFSFIVLLVHDWFSTKE